MKKKSKNIAERIGRLSGKPVTVAKPRERGPMNEIIFAHTAGSVRRYYAISIPTI